MLRFSLALLIAGWTCAANAASLETSFSRWERLRSPDAEHIRFEDGRKFLEEHADWPEIKIIRLRTEAAALNERPEKSALEPFCTDSPPLSGRGMIACAIAGVGSTEQQEKWIRQGWLQGDFNADEEKRIHSQHAKFLGTEDHVARMERLLYDGSAKAAKRMLPLVPQAKHRIYETRLAFMTNDKASPRLLKRLSTKELHDTGIIFERARWRMRHGETSALAELLLMAPESVPYPDRWWPLRVAAAREAIHKRSYKTALKLIEHHGDLDDDEDLADALWLKGWLRLRHLNDAPTAYKDFFKLYTSVYTPVSKARAAYWAGRAAESNGNTDIAHEWMEKAARYPTVFYGQLANHWLAPKKPLKLPEVARAGEDEQKRMRESPLIRVAQALEKAGDHKLHDRFLAAIAAKTTTQTHFAALAEVGRTIGSRATGVEIAKLALRNNIVLLEHGWPQIELPKNVPLEPALTLAITRQESEFDPKAVSPSNAQGLMQLLPSTAKQMAKKLDRPYDRHTLMDPLENLTLGSHYLARMIDGFDGSYILGIASYNAGPGNVRKWLAARGAPPHDLEKAIDWVESIPFGETRNYVMRVLENVSTYRTLANPEAPLMIAEDLIR